MVHQHEEYIIGLEMFYKCVIVYTWKCFKHIKFFIYIIKC